MPVGVRKARYTVLGRRIRPIGAAPARAEGLKILFHCHGGSAHGIHIDAAVTHRGDQRGAERRDILDMDGHDEAGVLRQGHHGQTRLRKRHARGGAVDAEHHRWTHQNGTG